MKQEDFKNQDKLLHQLLDGDNGEPSASPLTGPNADRLFQYRESLKVLETHQEKAPADFTTRVMAAISDRPGLAWTDRLRSFWPQKRFWAIPAFSGALAMFLVITGLTLLGPSQKTGMIPVSLDLYAPTAKEVQLVGTFSGWESGKFPLKGPDAVGYWAILVKLPPGRYEYAFLVNGSNLVPDDNGEIVLPDGCGFKNSLMFLDGDDTQGVTPTAFFGAGQADTLSLPAKHEDQWRTIFDDGTKAGFQGQQLRRTLNRLASSGLGPAEAREILEPLFQDSRAGLHAMPVLLRLDEALLKKMPLKELKTLTRARHDTFTKAASLLTLSGYSLSTESYQALLEATAFALESGFPSPSLRAVLTAGKNRKPRQITEVLELGETLYYAGLDPETLLSIMETCLAKNLDVQQMERVTDHVRESLLKGQNHRTIMNTLWIQALLESIPQTLEKPA